MKKVIVLCFAIFIAFAFKIIATDHTAARVKFNSPYLIFLNSQPVDDYILLGKVRCHFENPDNMTDISGFVTKKAQSKYPTADALILDDDFGGFEAIKFK